MKEPETADINTECVYSFEITVIDSQTSNDDITGLTAKLLARQDSNEITPTNGQEITNEFFFFGQHAAAANAGLEDSDSHLPQFNQKGITASSM